MVINEYIFDGILHGKIKKLIDGIVFLILRQVVDIKNEDFPQQGNTRELPLDLCFKVGPEVSFNVFDRVHADSVNTRFPQPGKNCFRMIIAHIG
ncbi:MAG: hypothetical protein A4E74_02317 [Syntrophus sp. PtaB.Bin075]|nr:MAG: hypothetical protein A4E74_02317 [Syntrophus sp. PtaB.Bin075]